MENDDIITIGQNVEFKHSNSKRREYVHGFRPQIIKSHSRQWVKEDILMEYVDTTRNEYTQQEVGHDYNTRDKYLETIVFLACFVCHGNKEFKWRIIQRYYINHDLPVGSMPS